MVDAYLRVLEMSYFEVQEAFRGLADANAWKRPADGLLSVGELAGHIAFWEAQKFAGEGKDGQFLPDLSKCRVRGPLVDDRFAYYPGTIETPPSEAHLAMTAAEVCRELVRVHQEALAHFKALKPDLDSPAPGWPPSHTYRHFLEYAVFHVSYHTGQIFSARHLLGEETPDN